MGFLTSNKNPSGVDPLNSPASVGVAKELSATVADAPEDEDFTIDLRHHAEARMAFLATFSASDEKTIMRKIDRRFVILIGLMFMFKNVMTAGGLP